MAYLLKKTLKLLFAVGLVYLVWGIMWCYGATNGGVCHWGPLTVDSSWIDDVYIGR